MDPNPTNADMSPTMRYVKDMEGGAQAVKLVPFAYAFRISFNVEPLRQYLEQRKRLGGLEDYEILAESLLAEQSMSPHDLAVYLEQTQDTLE